MKRIVLTNELMAAIEDAAFDWELSEDGRRLDVGPDLWQLHDRWILNDDGSLDQYKKRERSAGYDYWSWFASWEYGYRWLLWDVLSSGKSYRVPAIFTRFDGPDKRFSFADVTVHGRERVQMSVGGVAVARMKYYEVDFASHVLLASIPDLVESLTATTGEPLFGLRDDRG
ncbi:hypothetical protein ON058_02900 [Demequina sp. B12]|uniref:hypothetical protein n=1 Tax=Demequina sp. B12 TaxID=2992757 RepID=UPI00237B950B|nr:hypothetical protein [Demequina sp. B12]MDE0572359.1 hypothetical protein [Demequina sp. B12]